MLRPSLSMDGDCSIMTAGAGAMTSGTSLTLPHLPRLSSSSYGKEFGKLFEPGLLQAIVEKGLQSPPHPASFKLALALHGLGWANEMLECILAGGL